MGALEAANYAILKLDEMLEHPDPGFICANPFGALSARYVARVRHWGGEEAKQQDLLWLTGELGPAFKPFALLYLHHDGCQLFIPKIPRFKRSSEDDTDGGFTIFPLQMVRQSREMIRKHYGDCGMPDGSRASGDLLAFATVPLSGNLICLRTKRDDHRGEIAELNHDAPPGGFGHPKVLADLLNLVRYDPPFFFLTAGGYTFYSDGQTEAQWRPIRYVPDCGTLTNDEVAAEPLPDWLTS